MATIHQNANGPCRDAIRHSPPDAAGYCAWCRRKIERAMPAPKAIPRSELTDWYEMFYNPDYEPSEHL